MPRARLLLPPRPRRAVDFSLAIVNIVLLLIFFFLISGTLVRRDELAVVPPETSDLPLDRLPRPLLLMAPEGEDWSLDGHGFAAADLGAALDSVFGGTAPPVLFVLAGAGLPADALMGLMQRPELSATALRLVTVHVRPEPPP